MVLAERGIQDIRSGRRSRAASPNGHVSDGSSATEETEHAMKIGENYQAVVPDTALPGPCPATAPENALLIWSPHSGITDGTHKLDKNEIITKEENDLIGFEKRRKRDEEIDTYIVMAKEKYGYNVEQSLGMLFWHKYKLEGAIADLKNFTPFPDEWTVEDKVLFEQAFQFHGKSFHKIRQMLPDKSIACLVKYYYSWKKIRTRTSLMDRQVRKLSAQKEDGSDNCSDAHSENDSDMDAENKDKSEGSTKATCSNCNAVTQVFNTPKGSLCQSCSQLLKRTGSLRSTSGAIRTSARYNPLRSMLRPPRGMHMRAKDLLTIVTSPPSDGDAMLKGMDAETISLKRHMQNNKQIVGQLKHKSSAGIDHWRPPESVYRINARWTNDELLLGVQAIRKYGRNWKAVAGSIGTKTEAHVRSYFINYRRRYNLDKVLQEYDAEHGIAEQPEHEEKAEADRNGCATSNGSHPTSPASTTPIAPPLLLRPQSPSAAPNTSNHPRLCPPPLQQANPARGNSSGRTLLQQPPPLICPSNFINGSS